MRRWCGRSAHSIRPRHLLAGPPAEDISAKHHPNLAAAQRLSRDAWEKILAAQKANEWDMDGHAAKAKELLDQVNNELKIAAEYANKNKDKDRK